MFYVLLSVICSVSVSVLIKFARHKGVDTLQMLVWNYPTAVLLAYFIFSPDLSSIHLDEIPYSIFLPLSFLMPALFVCIAYSIRYTGIIKTEVAQRLSLFIPLLAAYFLFGETIGWGKLGGIALGFIAILLCLSWTPIQDASEHKKFLIYPMIVFVGMGVIDVLFKRLSQWEGIPYGTLLFLVFFGALVFAFLYYCYLLWIRKNRLDRRSVYWGVGLGLLNFGNILFYLKAHQNIPDNPSIVFTSMNIGVIVLGALAGLVLFGEKLSNLNKLGILIAILSVIIITYA